MDPNRTLELLREFYNNWQDDNLTAEDAEEMVQLFDDLDNWIVAGGFLPDEWQR